MSTWKDLRRETEHLLRPFIGYADIIEESQDEKGCYVLSARFQIDEANYELKGVRRDRDKAEMALHEAVKAFVAAYTLLEECRTDP
jgi:hypothetical protein